jgi:hypothetical protein
MQRYYRVSRLSIIKVSSGSARRGRLADIASVLCVAAGRSYGGSADRIGHCADTGRQNVGRSFHRTVETK